MVLNVFLFCMLFSLTHYTEPRELAAAIIGEPNASVTVTMNSPISLHCYAWGWPRPFVTWWQGDRMLPLSSEIYEQDSDYTLLIRTVTLPTLGVYTCQAFNAIGRAASWSVILQAVGPVYNINPEYEQYLKYLVDPPKKDENILYPYRPNRTQTTDFHTYGFVYTTRQTHISTVNPIGYTTLDFGSRFRGERVLYCSLFQFSHCTVLKDIVKILNILSIRILMFSKFIS